MSVERKTLEKYLGQLLTPELFNDYGPNGLQIEGVEQIHKIAFAVSATKASIEKTVELGAQALIVHHGLFWKFHGVRTLTGTFAKRVLPLARHEINLFGYHLPLDAHLEVGNAATLAQQLELKSVVPFGDHHGAPTGVRGHLPNPLSAREFKQKLESVLKHSVLMASPDEQASIQQLGIITGGANSDWSLAARLGLDAYLTGEMSEHDWNESQEAGIHMFAGGHYATEQFGIQALMQRLQSEFSVECVFIPSCNPA